MGDLKLSSQTRTLEIRTRVPVVNGMVSMTRFSAINVATTKAFVTAEVGHE